VPPDATRCPACGDALAQRESIADLDIPGVTTVDPTLQAYAAQPFHAPLPMPMSVDPIGGPIYLAGMTELAALAATENVGAGAPVDPSTLGKPSDAALQAVERLDREGHSGTR
jgi:hypothetical protein